MTRFHPQEINSTETPEALKHICMQGPRQLILLPSFVFNFLNAWFEVENLLIVCTKVFERFKRESKQEPVRV